jgi:hypothetical protein
LVTLPLTSVNSLPISLKVVYNVDTCDSDTEGVSDQSNGCGFSSIRLRMSDVEVAISQVGQCGEDSICDLDQTYLNTLNSHRALANESQQQGRSL